MDNIIKIILRQSGGLAEMVKTMPLYVGMYNTAILNVYVPQSLVSEGISVKVGAILTANDGTKATTDSLPMTYKGEETFCNEEYSVYELNPFPANFLTYAGQQDLVVNIVTIENEEVASVVTTQICKVDVLDSALIPDEELEASAVDLLSARITTNEQNISTNTDNITANTGQIAQNTQDISENTQKIAEIEQKMSTGENYVGSLTVSTLTGIETTLNNLVQQVESREPANGDVVMVTLEVTGGTDEIYKYFYTADGWQSYQMPAIESASNTDKGIIKGTLGENKNTQVDITGGEINAIYVKDNNNVLRDIREYANTTKTSIDNIISGDTKVGHSVKADQDQNGNEITNTYLTQNAGVTKTQMREYALPREFNDIYYLSKDQSNRPIITKDKPSQALTFTGEIPGIGTYPLIFADFISDASFELSSKNSYQSTFFVSVPSDVTAQFRLDIIYMGEIISTEFSNEMVMSANNIYKVQFNENFNNLEDVIQYDGQYPIKIMLSVVQTTSDTNTYTAYQNSTYVSTFNLNTNKYVISLQNGNLGEIKSILVDGYEIEQGIISFEMIDDEHLLKNNCLVEFKLSFNGTDLTKQIKLVQTFSSGTNEEYHLKTPYNTDAFNDRPTIENFKQTSITISGGVTTIRFVGLVKVIEGYGTEIFVNEDNLTEILALINSKQDALTAGSHIDITNDVISAEGGVYRGTFGTWDDVPSTTTGYEQDVHGNTTPLKNDYIVLNVGSGKLNDASFLYTSDTSGAGASIANTYNGVTQSVIYYNAAGSANAKILNGVVSVYYNSNAGKWIVTTLVDCVFNSVSYTAGSEIAQWGYASYSEGYLNYDDNTNGGMLIYDGVWATNGKNGWKAVASILSMSSGLISKIGEKQDKLTQTQLDAVNSGMTSADKTKLDGIQAGAEVNVQADWDQNDSSADDYIKNKPNIPAGVVVDTALDATSNNAIANSAVTNALNNKMDKANPTGTGSLSINRKANSNIGANSVAIGNNCIASGNYSHAEGDASVSSGIGSHAEGNSGAGGDYSHAEGNNTFADGDYSHAEGNNTFAFRRSQHVFGEFNIGDDISSAPDIKGTYVEIVGNGTPLARSNARTLDWNGNEVLAGTSQATGFKTANGTSSQFLKADGSVDSTTATNITNLQNSKQDTLVSGTNIKTINNTSLLGSGNISIGSSVTDVQVDSTSITSSGVANLKTVGGNYNSSSNKLLTKNDLLNQVYPVGSIYLTVGSSSPASWLGGTWSRLPEGYALWTASSGAYNGSSGTISAGLPNIKGYFTGDLNGNAGGNGKHTGPFYLYSTSSDSNKWGGNSGWNNTTTEGFDASRCSSIYKDDVSTVQPPAIKVYAWRRTA